LSCWQKNKSSIISESCGPTDSERKRTCKDSPQSKRYSDLANHITEALGFMRACGVDPERQL
jgi:hypothetical protein